MGSLNPESTPGKEEIRNFLDEKVESFNRVNFIETDPIQIPKQFTQKEDIEIAGFLAASIAWGQRPTIIRNAWKLIRLMENQPYRFLTHTTETDWSEFDSFTHRTFNGTDCRYFLKSLQNIYLYHGGLETVFNEGYRKDHRIESAIIHFRKVFFRLKHEARTEKHVADVQKGSSAKRINMFKRIN